MDKLGRHLYRVGTFSLNETERVLLGDGKVICRIARQSTFHADSDWCHAMLPKLWAGLRRASCSSTLRNESSEDAHDVGSLQRFVRQIVHVHRARHDRKDYPASL